MRPAARLWGPTAPPSATGEKKRESEVAEARRKAEEARKQREKEKAKKPHCVSHTGNEIAGLLPCVMAGGDVTPVIDPTLTAVVWELTDLNSLKECVKNPTVGECTSFAISILPIGKIKLLKKLGEGVEDIVKASRVAKKAKCFQCFLAGTKVLMADRSTKNIESVRVGDEVIATDPVKANRPFGSSARTYNLTVDSLHTYYVLAGETPVLVHNSSCFSTTQGKLLTSSSRLRRRVHGSKKPPSSICRTKIC
ncbi:hypothetical protein ACIQU1_08730 [Streptomyces angustmyceticus]|uniref:hypothetical protein n=1 Tax=Streptomyces angustmyceticus TaxID=285578 RepID=UPI0038145C82